MPEIRFSIISLIFLLNKVWILDCYVLFHFFVCNARNSKEKIGLVSFKCGGSFSMKCMPVRYFVSSNAIITTVKYADEHKFEAYEFQKRTWHSTMVYFHFHFHWVYKSYICWSMHKTETWYLFRLNLLLLPKRYMIWSLNILL